MTKRSCCDWRCVFDREPNSHLCVGKSQKKVNKKGKGKKGKETEVAEEETVSFIDCFVKVTDFGGPLFKPYDRRDEERNGR